MVSEKVLLNHLHILASAGMKIQLVMAVYLSYFLVYIFYCCNSGIFAGFQFDFYSFQLMVFGRLWDCGTHLIDQGSKFVIQIIKITGLRCISL